MVRPVPQQRDRLDVASHALAAIVPAAVSWARAPDVPVAAHDAGVVRTLGAGGLGLAHALDRYLAWPLRVLPGGTAAWRVALLGGLALSTSCAIVYPHARDAVGRIDGDLAPARRSLAALVAVVALALLWPVQAEAQGTGGAALGALLLLATFAATEWRSPHAPAATALLAGLSASVDAPVAVAALALAALAMVRWRRERVRVHFPRICAGFAAGLAPLAAAWLERSLVPRRPLVASLAFGWMGDAALAPRPAVTATLGADYGWVLLALTAAGLATAARRRDRRSLAPAIVLGLAVAFVAMGAPFGASRYGSLVVAATLLMAPALAIGLATAAGAVRRAHVPFAAASSAMVLVLELVIPVKALDETLTRSEGARRGLTARWTVDALDTIPDRSLFIVRDRALALRLDAAAAAGSLRGDVHVIAAWDTLGARATRLRDEMPEALPLLRDLAMGVAPEPASVSAVSAKRPVVLPFDARYDRSVSRSLLPAGLFTVATPEPRNAAERLEMFRARAAAHERLVHELALAGDADLTLVTVRALRARALAMASTGERDPVTAALDELRAVAPHDALGDALVRRMLTTKGAIPLEGLEP